MSKTDGGLVSAIVPSYNRERLVIDALESIRAQTYRPLEVIIVDDGSDDGTRDKVSEWKAMHDNGGDFIVRYVYQKNQGGNVARNRGIEEADGFWIAFLDSDDLWHPEKLERQIACFSSSPDVGAVYCGLRQIDVASGKIPDTRERSYPQGWIFERMIVRDVTAPTSTYVVRKDVFSKTGLFDVELLARQDWDMWIRISRYFQILCVEASLVDFRHHSGARTASNPQKEIDAYRKILEKYAGLREQCSFPVRQAALSAYYRRMGKVHVHYLGRKTQAFSWYLKALVAWPFEFDNYAASIGLYMPKDVRTPLHRFWNRIFGKTRFSINSH